MMLREQIKGLIRKTLSTISPTLCSKLLYYRAFRRKLDLQHPQTLNEKLMWLKLNEYEKNPLVVQCADKYRVRDYVKAMGCGEILDAQTVPTGEGYYLDRGRIATSDGEEADET